MTLQPKSKLGLYEIISPLGAGGMGEVYRAKDTNLDREVAIKVLPDEMARDVERITRFEREAKLLASLNHPNIAAVYGFDRAGDTRFLVLEYVEGQTLSKRLEEGPLAVEDALDVAKQMAEGLEAAHDKGIIHRDLKPANIMIDDDGMVKILDFGLAKAMSDAPSGSTHADSPTLTADYTQPGVILGTAAYMSPEQARGRSLDKRTDIWSFGVLLFECLSGATLFRGETATDSMGAILHKEPQWSLLPPNIPPTIQLLLRRCLAKDRKKRLHDIADARVELEQAIEDPTSSSLGLARAALEVERSWLPSFGQTVILVILLAGAAAAAWLAKPEPLVRKPLRNLTMAISDDQQLIFAWPIKILSISRDGSHVAYLGTPSATDDSFSQIYIRALDQPEAIAVPNANSCSAPCFSPDGHWLAFCVRDALKKVSTRGGPATTICTLEGFAMTIEWGSDDTIVYGKRDGKLFRVPAAGGIAIELLQSDKESEGQYHQPHFLPDASGIIISKIEKQGDWDTASVMVLRFDGGEPKKLISGGVDGRYVGTGHLVYRRENTLMAAPFDLNRLEVTGPAVPVLEGVGGSRTFATTQFDVADDGTVVYCPGSADAASRSLAWLDQEGVREPLSSNERSYQWHALSPDGAFVAVEINEDVGGESNIYILERERDLLRRLTSDPASDERPIWTPDGKWIVFRSDRDSAKSNLYRVPSDFSGKPQRLTTNEHRQFPSGLSPDGRILVFSQQSDIYLLRFDEAGGVAGEPELFVGEAEIQWSARFSPDGKWLAYVSVESGESKIYVKAVDGSGATVLVSTGKGYHPHWSPVESKLFYTANWPVRTMMSVIFTAENGVFKPALPVEVFDLNVGGFYGPGFELSPDGKRFSVVVPPENESGWVQPRIITNWFEDLKKKVPTGTDQ